MTTYTVLAYRENSLDSCRGCVIERSDSAFDFGCFQNIEDAAAYWAQKRRENHTSEQRFAEWQLTLLVDGLDENAWQTLYSGQDVAEPAFWQMYELSGPHLARLEETATQAAQAAADAQAERNRIAAQAAATAQTQREQATLLRLTEKYGYTLNSLTSAGVVVKE